MHCIHRGSAIFPHKTLERRPVQETLISCEGLHNIKDSMVLNIHPVYGFVSLGFHYFFNLFSWFIIDHHFPDGSRFELSANSETEAFLFKTYLEFTCFDLQVLEVTASTRTVTIRFTSD
jgi:hypothetical protein